MTKEKKSFKSVISNAASVTGRFFVKYKYFFAKIGVAILTLSLSVVLLFFLLRMIPGDIVELYALKLQNQQGITYDRAYELASQLLNYNPNEDVFSAFFRYVGQLLLGSVYRRIRGATSQRRGKQNRFGLHCGVGIYPRLLVGIVVGDCVCLQIEVVSFAKQLRRVQHNAGVQFAFYRKCVETCVFADIVLHFGANGQLDTAHAR